MNPAVLCLKKHFRVKTRIAWVSNVSCLLYQMTHTKRKSKEMQKAVTGHVLWYRSSSVLQNAFYLGQHLKYDKACREILADWESTSPGRVIFRYLTLLLLLTTYSASVKNLKKQTGIKWGSIRAFYNCTLNEVNIWNTVIKSSSLPRHMIFQDCNSEWNQAVSPSSLCCFYIHLNLSTRIMFVAKLRTRSAEPKRNNMTEFNMWPRSVSLDVSLIHLFPLKSPCLSDLTTKCSFKWDSAI
jgi:hypothetical protein